MLELDLETHKEEIKNVNGGCSCTCNCNRGNEFSSAYMGEMEIGACFNTCNGLSHGGRSCSASCP